MKPAQSLGIRHVALNVQDPQRSKEFYTRTLGMEVEWEPDPENIYLTTGGHDNLALHKAEGMNATGRGTQFLDHIGIMVPSLADVDAWYERIKTAGAEIVKEIKTHRDGARSFYFKDPDGIVIQLIYHEPVARRSGSESRPD